jgi:hypothetical protein
MKAILIILSFTFIQIAVAKEVKTECPWMKDSERQNIKSQVRSYTAQIKKAVRR